MHYHGGEVFGTCQQVAVQTLPSPSPSNNQNPQTLVSSGPGINETYIKSYKDSIVNIINSYLVPTLIAIAFIVFLYGIYKFFILGASEEGTKGEGRSLAMWGVIGFVVILSVWGIVNIVKDTLVPTSASQNHPAYPTL